MTTLQSDDINLGFSGEILDWSDLAVCATVDPEIFFEKARESQAVAVCRQCPVRNTCLTTALDNMVLPNGDSSFGRYGVWGGTTGRQRKAIRYGVKRMP